jgi:hypothetical protein
MDPTSTYRSLITEDDIENIDVQMLYVGVVKKPDRLLPTIRHFQELTQNLILDNLVKLQTRTATEIILYLKHSVLNASMSKGFPRYDAAIL